VDPSNKSSLRQFADQLVRGKEDRKKLDNIMANLDRVKKDLSLVIDMHQVKISYNISQAVGKKGKGTIRVDQKPKSSRSTASRVNVTAPTQKWTNTQLSDSGISSMDSEDDDSSTEGSSEASESDERVYSIPQVPITRVRKNNRNKTGPGALMINAFIGKVDRDPWSQVQVIEIEDNEAEEDSVMYNYPIDERGYELMRKEMKARTEEKREKMLCEREERRARRDEEREQMLWEKENGFSRSSS